MLISFRRSQIIALASTFFLIVFLAADLRTYFIDYISLTLSSLILFVLSFLFYGTTFVFKKRYRVFSFESAFVLVFISLLFIRLIFDIYILDFTHVIFANKYTYLVYCVFYLFMPIVFTLNIDFDRINVYFLELILTLLILFALYYTFRSNLTEIIVSKVRNEANEVFDTIAYGHLATTLCLLCLAQISRVKFIPTILVLVLVFIFGFFSIVIANSRSPFIALFVVLLLYIILQKKKMLFLCLLVSLILLFVSFDDVDQFLYTEFNSSFLSRLSNSVNDGGSGRDTLFILGFNTVLENPIFGESMFLQAAPYKGMYVHNSIIEAFMATGLIGGCIYLYIIAKGFYFSLKLIKIKSKYIFFAFLFIQYLIYSLFSRTLLLLIPLWLSLAAVYSCYYSEFKKS